MPKNFISSKFFKKKKKLAIKRTYKLTHHSWLPNESGQETRTIIFNNNVVIDFNYDK